MKSKKEIIFGILGFIILGFFFLIIFFMLAGSIYAAGGVSWGGAIIQSALFFAGIALLVLGMYWVSKLF